MRPTLSSTLSNISKRPLILRPTSLSQAERRQPVDLAQQGRFTQRRLECTRASRHRATDVATAVTIARQQSLRAVPQSHHTAIVTLDHVGVVAL